MKDGIYGPIPRSKLYIISHLFERMGYRWTDTYPKTQFSNYKDYWFELNGGRLVSYCEMNYLKRKGGHNGKYKCDYPCPNLMSEYIKLCKQDYTKY